MARRKGYSGPNPPASLAPLVPGVVMWRRLHEAYGISDEGWLIYWNRRAPRPIGSKALRPN